MSQHYLKANDETTEVMVGWDRPLGHFFATAFPANGEPVEITHVLHGVKTLEALAQAVAPYAVLPDDVRRTLAAESLGLAETNRIVRHTA